MSEHVLDDCWRSIGVMGDASCPELQRHVHCRNCDRYAEAAQRSLQRPVDEGYRAAWARELAWPEPPPQHTDSAAMAFRVGHEWLALPLTLAHSVAPLAPVHRLPHRSLPGAALLGIVNVGGRLVPAVSLARLLGIDADGIAAPLGRHAFARLLVLSVNGRQYALPVDEVHGVVRHAASAMRPPAATVGQAPQPLLAGLIGDSAIEAGLLDGARLERQLEGLLQ